MEEKEQNKGWMVSFVMASRCDRLHRQLPYTKDGLDT